MNIFLCLACEFVEEERSTGKEHHNTVEDCVEEKKHNLCVEGLCKVLQSISGLKRTNISDK